MKTVKQFGVQRKRDRKRRTNGRRVPRYAGLTVEPLESRLLLSAGNLQGDTLDFSDFTGDLVFTVGQNVTVSDPDGASEVFEEDIAHVIGGSGNDRFVVENGFSGALTIDGGLGIDSLVIRSQTGSYVVAPDAGGSGVADNFDASGRVITYAGLEPLLDTSNPNEVIIHDSGLGDMLLVEDASPASTGTMQIRSVNPANYFLVGHTAVSALSFANPPTSLTIGLNFGGDTLQFGSLDPGFMASILINALDQNDVVIGQDMYLPGQDIAITGGAISVSDGVVISTRKVNSNGEAVGNAGDITLEGKSITIGAGAELRAEVEEGSVWSAGAITVTASNTAVTPAIQLIYGSRDATIQVGAGAILQGGSISLTAEAGDAAPEEMESKFLTIFENYTIKALETILIDNLSLPLAAMVKEANARVEVGADCQILSSGQVTLEAGANADGTVKAISGGLDPLSGVPVLNVFSVAFSMAEATAETLIHSGVQITAAGDVHISSDAAATASATARTSENLGTYPGNRDAMAISIAAAVSSTTSHVTLSAGAEIQSGGNVSLAADGTSTNIASAETGVYDNGFAGISVGLGFSDTDIKADIQGVVTAEGRGTPDDEEDVEGIRVYAGLESKEITSAVSGLKGDPLIKDALLKGEVATVLPSIVHGTMGKLRDAAGNNNYFEPGSFLSSLSLAGTVAYANIDNVVTASIAGSAELKSKMDIVVDAQITDRTQMAAESVISGQSSDEGGGTADSALSAAVIVGDCTNHVTTEMAGGAQLNARRDMDITATLSYPFLTDPASLYSGEDFVSPTAIGTLLDQKLGIQSKLFNSWARSVGNALPADGNGDPGKVGFAFSWDYMSYTNTVEAIVHSGALINQNYTGGDYTSDEQSVSVEAVTEMQLVDMAGVFDINLQASTLKELKEKKDSLGKWLDLMGAQGGSIGLGGSVLWRDIEGSTAARIEDGAAVHTEEAGSLLVNAESNITAIALSQSGSSGAYSFNGTVSYIEHTITTIAQIESGAQITGGSVTVSATETSFLGSLVGSVMKGENIGVGVSVGINQITHTTTAVIGSLTDEPGSDGTSIIAAGNISVTSNTGGKIGSFVIAAGKMAEGGKEPTKEKEKDTTEVTKKADEAAQKRKAEANDKGKQGKFGLGISGDVSIQDVTDYTRAFVNDDGTFEGDTISVSAESQTDMLAVAGAVLISTKEKSLGIAGSYSQTTLTGETAAYICGATLEADSLNLYSHRSGQLYSFSAGGSGAPKKGGIAVAGSVSINEVSHTTKTSLDGVGATISGNVNMTSLDDSEIFVIAGAVAFGGKAGIGAAVSLNDIANNTLATISNTEMWCNGGLTLSATNDNDLQSIAGAAGISTNNIGAAGTVAVNEIDNTTEASLSNSRVPTDTSAVIGSLLVQALDDSHISSIAGAIAGGKSAGIGAAVAYNEIGNETYAYADDTDITTDGAMSLSADSTAGINCIAIGAAGGMSLGLAGSVSLNYIENTVEASLRSGCEVSSESAGITLAATDQSSITADGGGAALAVGIKGEKTAGVLAVGVSVADNQILNSTTAYGDETAIIADGNITLTASSTATIDALSIGGAVAVAASGSGSGLAGSGAGAISLNEINNTVAAYLKNVSTITSTAGILTLSATDSPTIYADAIGGALAVGASGQSTGAALAIGVSVSRNIISDTAAAYIDNSALASPDNTLDLTVGETFLNATSNAIIDVLSAAASVSVGGSGSTGLALSGGGADSGNVILTSTLAYVKGCDLVSTGDVTLEASNTSTITATVAAVAVAAGGGGTMGVGASIGAALASNRIGWDTDGNRVPAKVQAYLENSDVDAVGILSLTADADETIDAFILAGSVAISAAGTTGVGLSGAGADAENKIATAVKAYIDGDGKSVITAAQIVLDAEDTSEITADVVGASLAGSVAGETAVSLSIGVSLAENIIGNEVAAYIIDSEQVTARTGNVSLTAAENATINVNAIAASLSVAFAANVSVALSGAGADGTNRIANVVQAYIADSMVETLEGGDIIVGASNTSAIDSLVGGVAGAISGGTVAAAGAIGVSLAQNLIGVTADDDGSGYLNQVLAYAENAALISDGNIRIEARSTETIAADSFAGSVAIAAGVGGAAAGSGAEATNIISSKVHAYMQDASGQAAGNMDVKAISNSEITKASAIGASLAMSLGAASVAVSLVDNQIRNDIQAYIDSSAAKKVEASGTISITADAEKAYMTEVMAVTASVSGGAVGLSGGGIDVNNSIANIIAAHVGGLTTLSADGDVDITASENAYLAADVTSVSVSVSLGAALGVALVENQIGSSIQAWVADASVYADNIRISADSTANIAKTISAGISASAVGVQGNEAAAIINTLVKAFVEAVELSAAGDVVIEATADNQANSSSLGGAFGAIAVGAMVADVNMGRGTGIDEVAASVGDDAIISARSLRITAGSTDTLLAESLAGGGGVVAAAGAQSNVYSDYATLARIGADAVITVNALTMTSNHNQAIDASADSYAIAAAAGSGAGVDNTIVSKANVEIGTGAEVTADTILINAINQLTKDQYADGTNLRSGSASLGNVTVLKSETNIGLPETPFAAVVTIAAGAHLVAEGDSQNPGVFKIEALNKITAVDSVRIESVSGFGVSVGISRLESNSVAGINLNDAILENKSGDVYLATRSDIALRPSANLLVVTALTGGAGAEATGITHAANTIEVHDSIIRGSDIYLCAGRDSFAVPNLLDGYAATEITAMSLLPNISVPVPTSEIYETNRIAITGASGLYAMEDVTLVAEEGLGGADRAETEGLVLSLSLIPYGVDVPDGGLVQSLNFVTIGNQVVMEAGINNQSIVQIKPLGAGDDDILARLQSDDPLVRELTAAEKESYDLPLDIRYEYAEINLEDIAFGVSTGTVILVTPDHTAGGKPGHYYRFLPDSDQMVSIVLTKEDFTDSVSWTEIIPDYDLDNLPAGTVTLQNSQIVRFSDELWYEYTGEAAGAVDLSTENFSDASKWDEVSLYQSDVTAFLQDNLEDKFYVIKPVSLAAPSLTYVNLGNLLFQQRQTLVNWITSHSSNAEAVARYQAQLDILDETLAELGLLETLTNPDDPTQAATLVTKDLDMLLLELPDIYAAPGSIFIETDSILAAANTPTTIAALLNQQQLIARAGAGIDVLNQTPFTLSVHDAVVRDNRRVIVDEGEYIVLTPGNVYFNNEPFTKVTDTDGAKTIRIIQNNDLSFPDLGDLELPPFDQDLYINGQVINENGNVTIINEVGSITVSGEIRADEVNIHASRDFTLNTDDWFHTNQDPRQYLDYDGLRSQAIAQSILAQQNPSAYENYVAADADGIGLTDAIDTDASSILAQGRIVITARYLNIDGLIQSGVDTITLIVDEDFTATTTTASLQGQDGKPLEGIHFGDDGVPVSGYFDAQKQAIVVREIVPQGGMITLAGQILSTGNGCLKVANGYTSVLIENNSQYDLILNRIDTTTNRTGIITIIDTALLTKTVYEMDGEQVRETVYQGTLSQADPTDNNGYIASIVYAEQSSHPYDLDETILYRLETGLTYLWTEGQESTKTTVTKYEKKTFNLFGDNAFADLLVRDSSFKWQTIEYTDEVPLLESEVLLHQGDLLAPEYLNGHDYTISYEQRSDIDVDVIKNVTLVKNVGNQDGVGGDGKVYIYRGDNDELALPDQNYAGNPLWEATTIDPNTFVQNPSLGHYLSTYENASTEVDKWTTGGGWLRKKTYHTLITQIQGLKDYYTHTLKADYPITISFIQGPANPSISITSKNDVYMQGNITSPEWGTITLTSLEGSVTGADSAAIFGVTPWIGAGTSVRVSMEGDKGILKVTAGTDIQVSAVSIDNQSSRLVVGTITSRDGNVFLQAPNGITAADGNSLIQAERIELYARAGSIGSTGQPLRIDSNIHGFGGVAARADGDIVLRETQGDLPLIQPDAWANDTVSIAAAHGNVQLETGNGSILDAFYEDFSPAAQLDIEDLDPRIHDLIENGTFTLDSLEYPVSPGLFSYLYPHAEFLGLSQNSTTQENANITGNHITLIVGGQNSQVGHISAPVSLNLAQGFENLTQEQKVILSTASTDDVVGIQYELYLYQGQPASGIVLQQEDFSDPLRWRKVVTDYLTETDRSQPQWEPLQTGQTVLVQFSTDEYGLYRYLGPALSLDLSIQDFSRTSLWQKVIADYATDQTGTVNLTAGRLVLNKYVVETVTIRLWDDINVEASGSVAAQAGAGVALQAEGSLSLSQIQTAGDVRLLAGGSITDRYHAGTAAAIRTFGNLVLRSDASIGTAGGSGPLRIQIAPSSVFTAAAAANINVQQVSGVLVYASQSLPVSDLYVSRADAGGTVTLEVLSGDMIVGKINSGASIDVTAAGSILDAFAENGAVASDTMINLKANTDIRLHAQTGHIGTPENVLEINSSAQGSGYLEASAGESIYLTEMHGDLRIQQVVSDSGDILLSAPDGDVNLGQVQALDGLVTITTSDAIFRTGVGQETNILAPAALLLAGEGIGSSARPILTELNHLEADGGQDQMCIHNEGALVIGGVSARIGLQAAGEIQISAQNPIRIEEDVCSAGDVVLKALDSADSGDDLTLPDGVRIVSSGGDIYLLAGDNLRIEANGTIEAAGVVYLAADYENHDPGLGGTIDWFGRIDARQVDIRTAGDDDLVNITNILEGGPVTVATEDGNDMIQIGSQARTGSNSGGTLHPIAALIYVDGGSGANRLLVDDSGEAAEAASSAVLTKDSLAGLGMQGGGIQYASISELDIRLGAASDTVAITSTHTGKTAIHLGAGENIVNLHNAAHRVSEISGELVLFGEGDLDTLNLDSTGDTGDASLILTATAIAGLGIPGSIHYGQMEELNIGLGSGSDVVNVQSTSSVTNLHLHDGDEQIYISSLAAYGPGESPDFLPGDLDAIAGTLNIDAGSGSHLLMISDEAAVAGDDSVLITDQIPAGLPVADTAINGLAPAPITFITDAANGNFAQGITIWTGSGDDTIAIDSTHRRDNVATLTTFSTGLGNDHITVTLDADQDGSFILNTGGKESDSLSATDDDWVDASGSSLPLIIYAGQGSDQITGGSGNDTIYGGLGDDTISSLAGDDILFGDEGQIQTGGSGPAIITTIHPELGGDDIIDGGDGRDLIWGGSGDDTLTGDLGDDLLFGDNGRIEYAADSLLSQMVFATTTDPSLAGNDTVDGGDGKDVIWGGSGDDTLTGGLGDDLLFGDNGRVNYTTDGSVSTISLAMTIDPTSGGRDTLYGGAGDDVIFGGTADDTLFGDGGCDILLGDHGQFNPTLPIQESFVSIDYGPADGGGNDTIHGGLDDDFILGQQGGDDLYGDEGDDDLIGGHNLAAGADGNDTISGGDGADVILGDNGLITRRLIGDNLWQSYPAPFTAVIRQVTQFYDQDYPYGSDTIWGDAGDDILYGQRGDDIIGGGSGDDEIYGGQGDDTLYGQEGNDILIAHMGTISRAFDENGQPEVNANGSWHRDVLLEDIGTLTGMMNISSNSGLDTEALLASRMLAADLIILAGAYQPDGSRAALAGTDTWDTVMLFIDLAEVDNSTLDGGDGDDILFGHRGDDTLSGADGDDVIFGDGALNVVPFATDLPHIYNSLRLVGAGAGLGSGSGSELPVVLADGGSVILNPITLLPDDLNDTAPFQFLPSVGTILPEAIQDFIQTNDIGPLMRTDGTSLVPYLSFVPDILGHTDILNGNDTISGGSGADMLFGDTGTFYSEITTELPGLQDAREALWNAFHTVLDGLHSLAIDYDTLLHTDSTYVDGHDLLLGNDQIDGSEGNDMIFGDNGLIIESFISALPQDPARYLDQSLQTQNYLYDLRHLVVDFDFTVYQAHYQVLDSLIDSVTGKKKLSKSDLEDPDWHDLILNNDQILAGAGNDLVFGDDGTVITAVLDTATVAASETSNQLETIMKSAQASLKANAALRSQDIKDHIQLNHDVQYLTFTATQKKLLMYDHDYDKQMNNNTIHGQDGDDLIIGNYGILGIPVLLADTAQDSKALQKDLDQLLLGLGRYADDQYDIQSRASYTAYHSLDFINRGGSKDVITLIAGNDTISGDAGDDFILGDSAAATVTWQAADPALPFGDGSTRLLVKNLDFNTQAAQQGQNLDKKTSILENDTLDGGTGSSVLYGQWGSDTLTSESDNNLIYGGSGKDTILGGGKNGGGDLPASGLLPVLSTRLFHAMDPLRQVLADLPADTLGSDNLAFDVLTGNRLVEEQLDSPALTDLGQDSFQLADAGDNFVSLLGAGAVSDYLEMNLSVTMAKAGKGTLANSYVIFDYVSPTDFKFAGINQKTKKLEIGQCTEDGWIVLSKTSMKFKAGREYTLKLILHGGTVSLVVNDAKTAAYTFDSQVNNGTLGLGTHNAQSRFDHVQIITFS